ncbi:MAG: hydrogenase maturation nickel metallochaperone HypA [Actinobacteria bacterium]|nr:hydrogenase maturation nickel metallochaperone HypA [Actinomycetota bacterium]
MHEMGIVAGILDAAVDAAKKAEAERITEIRVTVGELTEIVDFALQFAFEALTPGTLAEGAILTVNRIGARSRCAECNVEFDHGRFEMACPDCGNYFCELIQGKELRIDSIEADTPELTESQAPATGK